MSKYEIHWWLVCLFWVVLIILLSTVGCDDTTSPTARYLGPPVVEAMNATGNAHRLDAWALGQDNYPTFAAFGWRVSYQWVNTEQDFIGPGVHTTITMMSRSSPGWSPVLRNSVTGSGRNAAGDPESITAVSGNDGITNFYLSLHDWPYMGDVANNINVGFRAGGGAGEAYNIKTGSFGQDRGAFYADGGAWQKSYQDWPFVANNKSSRPTSPPMPDSMPMDLEPIMSPPKVAIADILPMEAECRGGDLVIQSQWMKARVVNGEWVLDSAPFITPLPCEPNLVESVVNTAWPYVVSFHVPAESAGLGVIDATLSIVDPNRVSLTAIDIQIHEVGQCPGYDGWLWRSDYILPLVNVSTGPLLTWAGGNVVAGWLPRGYKLKIEPAVNARTIYILSKAWLAGDSALDLDGNGVVNFTDYGILLGMK